MRPAYDLINMSRIDPHIAESLVHAKCLAALSLLRVAALALLRTAARSLLPLLPVLMPLTATPSRAAAPAAAYPNRPIRMIVPYGAGGIDNTTVTYAPRQNVTFIGGRYIYKFQ